MGYEYTCIDCESRFDIQSNVHSKVECCPYCGSTKVFEEYYDY